VISRIEQKEHRITMAVERIGRRPAFRHARTTSIAPRRTRDSRRVKARGLLRAASGILQLLGPQLDDLLKDDTDDGECGDLQEKYRRHWS